MSSPHARLRSVNVGRATATEHSSVGRTGIDKRPVSTGVLVTAPETGGGLEGDDVCDHRHHGGPDQAVYAYAWEDLLAWEEELVPDITPGLFGENLTTEGVDVCGARIGERWRVGDALVLEVTSPRIPCRTFEGRLGMRGWIKRFTAVARPGAYLRVIEPGVIRTGDRVEVLSRPGGGADVATVFRALTSEPALLGGLVDLPGLPEHVRGTIRARVCES